jgi:nicotinamidase-related amidase
MPDIRDPLTDNLLTPQNAALVLIDYQPVQVASIRSMPQDELVRNIVKVAKVAKLFQLPTVVTTVNVKTGINKPIIDVLREALGPTDEIDRTTVNAWEDPSFRRAVNATGRKKIVACALWTEVCLTFPTLDMLKEGFEVYPVVDAVGGTSLKAHEAGLSRMIQAGAQPTSWAQFICELQRDWARKETAKQFAEILFGPAHGKESAA